MPHKTSDVSPSADSDRPHTYHHIPTHARNPNGTSDADPFDNCGQPKPNRHFSTRVDSPRANHDADSSDSCRRPDISYHSFMNFIDASAARTSFNASAARTSVNASAARTSSNAHSFGIYRLPGIQHRPPHPSKYHSSSHVLRRRLLRQLAHAVTSTPSTVTSDPTPLPHFPRTPMQLSDVIPVDVYDAPLPNSSNLDMPHTTFDVSLLRRKRPAPHLPPHPNLRQ